MSRDPCEWHTTFQWDCQDCKNVRQKSVYDEIKDARIYCKYCKKDVQKIRYDRHKTSKFHKLIREIARLKA